MRLPYRWLLVFLYAALIFFCSSLSQIPGPQLTHLDKFYHFVVYSGFGFCIGFALKGARPQWNEARFFMVSAALVFLYAVSDEFHQSFVPGRSVEVLDVVADFWGGVFGAFLALKFLQLTGKIS